MPSIWVIYLLQMTLDITCVSGRSRVPNWPCFTPQGKGLSGLCISASLFKQRNQRTHCQSKLWQTNILHTESEIYHNTTKEKKIEFGKKLNNWGHRNKNTESNIGEKIIWYKNEYSHFPIYTRRCLVSVWPMYPETSQIISIKLWEVKEIRALCKNIWYVL